MPQKLNSSENTSDREIVLTRVFNAPRELVFDAWTDPKHIDQWWGPRGFTNTTKEIDIRVGGVWRYVMHGPDGKDWGNNQVFTEVTRPSRLAYDHGADDGLPAHFSVVIDFIEEKKGQTRLTMRSIFPSKEAVEAVKKFGAVEGGNQTVDRFAQHLASVQGLGDSKKPFITSRVFNAPRAKVWSAWTDAGQLKQWFGPKGFTMPMCKLDLRPGGIFHYCLRAPDGSDMWGKWAIREVIPEEKIVLVSSFSDAQGNVARHPGHAGWPLEMLSKTTFEDVAGGKTKLTIEWIAINATAAERQVFDDNHSGMTQGWGGTFEQLDAFLLH